MSALTLRMFLARSSVLVRFFYLLDRITYPVMATRWLPNVVRWPKPSAPYLFSPTALLPITGRKWQSSNSSTSSTVYSSLIINSFPLVMAVSMILMEGILSSLIPTGEVARLEKEANDVLRPPRFRFGLKNFLPAGGRLKLVPVCLGSPSSCFIYTTGSSSVSYL